MELEAENWRLCSTTLVGIGIKKSIFIESINNFYRIKKNIYPESIRNTRCAMKSLGIPSRVGPLVPWSSGPLVLWSAGPGPLVPCSPLVHWSASPLVLWSFVFLSFFFAAVLLSFFCVCLSFCSLCRDETKQGSKQASKEASKQASTSCSPLDLVCCWGGAAPPPTPPAPRNLHFIPDTRACHEINILR